jgi:hypothetical protein
MSSLLPRLQLAAAPNAGSDALRVLAVALLPYLLELIAIDRRDDELCDVLQTIPGPPRRSILRDCRSGAIANASCIGRRWIAPRASIAAYLRDRAPRVVPRAAADDLEAVRERLLRPGSASRAKTCLRHAKKGGVR